MADKMSPAEKEAREEIRELKAEAKDREKATDRLERAGMIPPTEYGPGGFMHQHRPGDENLADAG